MLTVPVSGITSRETEPLIGMDADLAHQADVFLVAVVVVARDVTGVSFPRILSARA